MMCWKHWANKIKSTFDRHHLPSCFVLGFQQMQTGRFPPTDGGQGAAGQEEENEKDEHQHGDTQQFQREHPLLLLLFAVSGEDANGGRAQSAAFQQPPRQNAGRRRDGLRRPERTVGLSLLGRPVRRQATDPDAVFGRRTVESDPRDDSVSASSSVAWTSACHQNRACSRSSSLHRNINQSINQSPLAIASLFISFSLTFTLPLLSIRVWTRQKLSLLS